MQQILSFLIRNKNTLLFLFLFAISLAFTVESHSYHKSKWISSTNFLSGNVFGFGSSIDSYFNLRDVNTTLVKENQQLRLQLERFKSIPIDTSFTDTATYNSPYKFYNATVIANSFSKKDNYILINKGEKDSIKPDMGVITPNGLLGIIENTSSNYSRIISILNSNLEINVGLKKSDHFGTLSWNGKSPYKAQLIDVGRLAPVKVGDTIITSGNSSIFPKGIPVGKISDFSLDQSKSYYKINVELFNDMTGIGPVYVIENLMKPELDSLKNSTLLNE
ncbi:rod shape-determining protein MreC [Croceibacter atlanticus]|uniref:rod shape-determining protein MreC n=1 Tax=Croceibacter atlanticus TaxID=313588 RepID=UPI0024BA4B9E|nr:rod shape-determining protein MreC [Croceibacter atlanticus]